MRQDFSLIPVSSDRLRLKLMGETACSPLTNVHTLKTKQNKTIQQMPMEDISRNLKPLPTIGC